MSPLTEPTRLTLAKGQPVPNDPYLYTNTVLLLHGDGANGSTNIVDSSRVAGSPKIVTPVGNAQISTAVADPFGNSARGVLAFDGTGDYLEIADSSGFTLGSADFTIEAWVNTTSTTPATIVCHRSGGGAGNTNWLLQISPSAPTQNKVAFYASDGATYQVAALSSTSDVNNGSWRHISVTRSGSTFSMFVNGAQEATATWAGSISSTSRVVQIGNDVGTSYLNGYIDDLRITKGVARYTSNFTPPTAPFPDF